MKPVYQPFPIEYFMSCFSFTFCSRRVDWHEVCADDTPNNLH